MRLLTLLLQPIAIIILVTSFFTLLVPISLIALPFRQDQRLRITQYPWGLFGKIIIYMATLTKLHKEDRRDEDSRKRSIPKGLYMANHQSMMDIPLLLTCFRVPPIMKKEVLNIPLFGIIGASSGAVPVDRSSIDSRKKVFEIARDRLRNGSKCLQYYPEGTRNKESDRPKPYEKIKIALLKVAYAEKIPVYPVSIYGTKNILSGSYFISFRQKVGLILHEAVMPEQFTSEQDFCKFCWSKVENGYDELDEKLS